jgi:hypothetical protein
MNASRRGRSCSGGPPGPDCRTPRRGPRCCLSTRESKEPVRRLGSIRPLCSSGGLGSASTSYLGRHLDNLAGLAAGDARRRARAGETADRLHAFLDGRRMPFGQAGRAMGVQPNSLRYGSPTGAVLLGRRPPASRMELARPHLRVFGSATAASFARRQADVPDQAAFRAQAAPAAPARLLSSGNAYYLLRGADREMLVPDVQQRAALWTTCVWPGALRLGGEIVSMVAPVGNRGLHPPVVLFLRRNGSILKPRRCRCRGI